MWKSAKLEIPWLGGKDVVHYKNVADGVGNSWQPHTLNTDYGQINIGELVEFNQTLGG